MNTLIWLIVLILVAKYAFFTGSHVALKMAKRRLDDDRRLAEDTLASIHLYVKWHWVTRQLTTEQKNFWADCIDADHRRQDTEEGTLGTNMAFKPVERWWQD